MEPPRANRKSVPSVSAVTCARRRRAFVIGRVLRGGPVVSSRREFAPRRRRFWEALEEGVEKKGRRRNLAI